MFCGNCGTQIADEVAVDAATEEKNEEIGGTELGPGLYKGADGIIRWNYEMNMWKNPTILITVWKVLLIGGSVPILLVTILTLIEEGFAEAMSVFGMMAVIIIAIVTGLAVIAYPIVALSYGGVYQVVFEMDDVGVKHIQMDKQYDKAKVLSMITVLAGIAGGSPGTVGAGLLAGSKKSSYSKFSKVKKVVLKPGRRVIYVNQSVERNQIYAGPENFDQIAAYITDRCKKAAIVKK